MSKTITKEVIAAKLKDSTGIAGAICEELTFAVFEEIAKLTEQEGKCTIRHFGTWKLLNKKPRPGFDITNNKPVTITPRNVLSFSASTSLKKLVNQN